jgi:hypothetical protein
MIGGEVAPTERQREAERGEPQHRATELREVDLEAGEEHAPASAR